MVHRAGPNLVRLLLPASRRTSSLNFRESPDSPQWGWAELHRNRGMGHSMIGLITTSSSSLATDPSYNGYVVAELGQLTAALEQYWQTRKAACEESIKRLEPLSVDRDAEIKWQIF